MLQCLKPVIRLVMRTREGKGSRGVLPLLSFTIDFFYLWWSACCADEANADARVYSELMSAPNRIWPSAPNYIGAVQTVTEFVNIYSDSPDRESRRHTREAPHPPHLILQLSKQIKCHIVNLTDHHSCTLAISKLVIKLLYYCNELQFWSCKNQLLNIARC